jgi:hypothetical protein
MSDTVKFMALCGIRVGVAAVQKVANQFGDHPSRQRYQIKEVISDVAKDTVVGESFTVGDGIDSVFVFDTAKEAAAAALEHTLKSGFRDYNKSAKLSIAQKDLGQAADYAGLALKALQKKAKLLRLARS